jgi:hypothetical protein
MVEVLEAALRRRPVALKTIPTPDGGKHPEEIPAAARHPGFPPAEQPPAVA